MINIAVMGYGTVGSGVVEVIRTNGSLINERVQDEIYVKYVLDLRDFPGDPVEEILTHDFDTILNDPEVAIVVETMGGMPPPTLASNIKLISRSRAISSSSAPCFATSALLDVATLLPASRHFFTNV